jgi:hypothetical protein
MGHTRATTVIASAFVLFGCQTLPKFNNVPNSEPVGPRVSDIMNEVQCEILTSLYKSDPNHLNYNADLSPLQNGQYVASINLTLDVTDNQSLDPSLSYIDPFKTAGTNFTGSLVGQLNGQQHRNINLTFNLLFDRNTPTDALGQCMAASEKSGLRGELGIEEIFTTGLGYETDRIGQNGLPYKIPSIGVNVLLGGADPLTGSAALAPNFGSTVDFTLIYGLSGGPNWTLKQFVGPSPSSGSLLSAMRTNKDTLIMSFARVSPTAPPPANANQLAEKATNDAAIRTAAQAAEDNITRMILQRLFVPE